MYLHYDQFLQLIHDFLSSLSLERNLSSKTLLAYRYDRKCSIIRGLTCN